MREPSGGPLTPVLALAMESSLSIQPIAEEREQKLAAADFSDAHTGDREDRMHPRFVVFSDALTYHPSPIRSPLGSNGTHDFSHRDPDHATLPRPHSDVRLVSESRKSGR